MSRPPYGPPAAAGGRGFTKILRCYTPKNQRRYLNHTITVIRAYSFPDAACAGCEGTQPSDKHKESHC